MLCVFCVFECLCFVYLACMCAATAKLRGSEFRDVA